MRVVNSVSPEMDAKMVSYLQSLPKWIPGKLNDKIVRVMLTKKMTEIVTPARYYN
jgi:hypothetical protein